MGIGHDGAVLFAAFAVAVLLAMFWKQILMVLAISVLGLLLVGAVQVALWVQALL